MHLQAPGVPAQATGLKAEPSRALGHADGRNGQVSVLLLLLFAAGLGYGQQLALPARTSRRTEAVGPMRFIGVHGRRSLVMGYPAKGLEVWAYPFQILSDYQIGFRAKGSTAEADGHPLLRNIDYQPDSVTRLYVGPDYLVREKIFVPLDDAAAVIEYVVEGTRQVDVIVHFQPVMDLMWPGSAGGQYTRWLDGSGFQITEPEHDISAVVGSPEAVAHDDTVNSTVRADTRLSFAVRPVRTLQDPSGIAAARVYFVLNAVHAPDPAAAMQDLSRHIDEKQAQAKAHYAALEKTSIRLHTPDDAVNRAVAWAEIALDQAWVCNPRIGCGLVAGYGPSRDARRPQYAWYFAGDGLIATNALVSVGEYDRAKEELLFIERYQEPKTGMIWHELSQSAGYIDWSKYPYMYVHVDITFDYLTTVGRYVVTSGDTRFAEDHWPAIAKAYGYCRSLIHDADHLPHIPADKEAGDEQARPGDDLALSTAWLTATTAYEELARLTGRLLLAEEAHEQHQLTRASLPPHYWDAATNFWIDGHSQTGIPINSRRRGPSALLEQHVFSEAQQRTLMDQIAGSDFQTDWGLREVAASSPEYDPYSYGRGSITAPGTTQAAVTFWEEHRPATGYDLWREILRWDTLDAPGHIHEVLAGNFYHEQVESVPEQTWSSAGFLDATVRGLLGIKVHGDQNFVEFTPHLPAAWDRITVENVRLPGGQLDFKLEQGKGEVDLEITNRGGATRLLFAPEIPLGAQVIGAEFQGRRIGVAAEVHPADEHARVTLDLPPGASRCRVRFTGGVSLIAVPQDLHVGDASTALKLTQVKLQETTLLLEADVHPQGSNTFKLRTPWKVLSHEGVTILPSPDGDAEVRFEEGPLPVSAKGYRHVHAALTFATK